MVQYESLILKHFKKLGLTPRPGQLEVINEILEAFYQENYKNVIINSPTGSGKSVIGLIVSMCAVEHSQNKRAWILMHQNVLMNNYFDLVENKDEFVRLKGASNYSCDVLKSYDYMDATADSCIFDKLKDIESPETSICSFCDYKNTRRAMHNEKFLVSNYSYFLIQMLYAKANNPEYKLHKAAINVFDESHIINETFSSHMAVFVSPKRFQYLLDDLFAANLSDVQTSISHWQLNWDSINDSNYKVFLTDISKAYLILHAHYDKLAKKHFRTKEFDLYLTNDRLQKKYKDYFCKIDDLFKYEYDHIFDKSDNNDISIKPIFIKDMIHNILFAEKNLFMSATNSPYLLEQQLNLPSSETKFINVKSSFPIENKKVYFLNIADFNMSNLKEPKIEKEMLSNIMKVVNLHKERNEKGIIITPSFKMASLIGDTLRRSLSRSQIFEHIQGDPSEKYIDLFSKSKGFGVLLSPSIWEGISLDDDLSRWQVIVKAPFGSLGDKRVAYIAKNYPKIYRLETLLKVIQGIGRSVRSKDDYATSYLLDGHLKKLFDSDMNVWAEQFETYAKD